MKLLVFLLLLLSGCQSSKTIDVTFYIHQGCPSCLAIQNELIPSLGDEFRVQVIDDDQDPDAYDKVLDEIVLDEAQLRQLKSNHITPLMVIDGYYAAAGYDEKIYRELLQAAKNGERISDLPSGVYELKNEY